MMATSRGKRLKINMIIMFIVKFLSMGISFLYMPLLLHSLETEQYAVWLTLTSIVSWITLFDIGLGNGLRNKLAESLAINDYDRGKQYISTAYGVLSFLSAFLILTFLFAFNFIPWNNILNAQSIPIKELDLLVIIVFISFIINFTLSLINSILYALQIPGIAAIISFIGQFVSFGIVLLSVKIFGITELLPLGAIISFTPVFVLFISTIIIFKFISPQLAPSRKFFNRNKIRDILSIGIKFFFIQIITIVLFQTNNLIITHVIDNSAVVEYNIAYKYTYILVTLFTIICMPMWSAATDAYTKGEIEWISKTRRKLYYLFALFVFVGIIMLVFSSSMYKLWIGADCPQIEFSTTAMLMLYSIFMMFYAANGYILNGIGKLNIQIIFTSILALLYVPMASILGGIYGLSGILAALCFNGISNSIWSYIQLNKIIKGRAYGIWNK